MSKGADVHTSSQSTALHLACRAGSERLVKFLVENNVDVNALRVDGVSPLTLTITQNNVAIAKLLLENGMYMSS